MKIMSFRKDLLSVLPLLFFLTSCQYFDNDLFGKIRSEIGGAITGIGKVIGGENPSHEANPKTSTNTQPDQTDPQPSTPKPGPENTAGEKPKADEPAEEKKPEKTDPQPDSEKPAEEKPKGDEPAKEKRSPIIVSGSKLELIVIPKTYTPPPPNRNGIIVIPPAPPY
ncbi:MAG: hypothetical protein IJU44_07350 [Kiritimatiellae bacterium]|nr:hypothetical protein [Kiritimatiellia bacterium]